MKNLFTILFFLFSVLTFSQTKQEVKSEILKLRKQGDYLDRGLNDGFYCKKYFSEWHNFNYRKLYTYSPPKTVVEVELIITRYQSDIAFLENLKKEYNRPNGALSRYNSDASKLNALFKNVRELEKSIDEYPYPLTWKYTGNCKNVIESINNKIRELQGFFKNKQKLKQELENNSSSQQAGNSKSGEQTNNNSTSNTNNNSSQQTGNTNNGVSENGNDNSKNSTNGLRTPEQINTDYKKFQETNIKAESQMGNGDFLGAANTYSEAGRETETYAALGGHVVTQFASLLANNRQLKIEKKTNTIEQDLVTYENIYIKLSELKKENNAIEYIKLEKKIRILEDNIIVNSIWIGNKNNVEYFKLVDKLRYKQLDRIKYILELNSISIFNEIDSNKFNLEKYFNLVSEELKYQTYHYFEGPYTYKRDVYATAIWTTINNHHNYRTYTVLSKNKEKKFISKKEFAKLYLTSNLYNSSFENIAKNTFKTLDNKERKEIALSIITNGTQDDYAFYWGINTKTNKPLFLHVRNNFKKLYLLFKDLDFNYYSSVSSSSEEKTEIPFHEYLKEKFYTPKFYEKYDSEKNISNFLKSSLKNDRKFTNKKLDQLFKERMNCIKPNCEQ